MNSHGQRNRGRGTSVPILPPPDRINILLSVRSLISCSLAARQLPYRGHRNPTHNLCSGRAGNRPPFIKVRRGPMGNIRSPTTRYRSHMPTLTRRGNKAAPTTSLGRGNLCHTTRTPRERGIRATEQPSMLTATNWPGQCTPVRTRHALVPEATPRPPPPCGNTQPSFRRASTGGRINGTMRGQPGRVAAPRPQPLAWEHANGSSRATTAGLPSTGNPTTVRNPSAYDSSAAEGDPSDRHPRSRSKGKRHRREAPSSPSKRRKTSHHPVWRPSSSSSESEDTES